MSLDQNVAENKWDKKANLKAIEEKLSPLTIKDSMDLDPLLGKIEISDDSYSEREKSLPPNRNQYLVPNGHSNKDPLLWKINLSDSSLIEEEINS